MTTIRLGVLHPTGTATDTRSSGSLEWVPTARRVVGADVVLPAAFTMPLSATADVTTDVAPTTSAWAWRVLERVTGGAGWRYLAVPDSAEVVDYASLAEVDLATLDPITAAPTVQALLDGKAPLASPAFTGTPTGITKAHVGLGSVDNTSDAAKPVSTAQAVALGLKLDATTAAATYGLRMVVSDTPTAPPEGQAQTYWVTSAVTWPSGLVWSNEPDAGVAPAISNAALVSLLTVGGVTYAVAGSIFAWLPTTIASIVAWYDAADTATITSSGGLVSQWSDKSGYARHLTAAGPLRPTTGTTTLNAKNALAFNGSNLLSRTAPVSHGTTFTIAMVTTPTSGTNGYLMELTPADLATQASIISGYGGLAFETLSQVHAGGPTNRYTVAASASGAHVVTLKRNGTALSSTYDGAAAGSATAAYNDPFLNALLYVGGSVSANKIIGTIAEVVIFNTALGATDLAKLNTYLKTKWGIA